VRKLLRIESIIHGNDKQNPTGDATYYEVLGDVGRRIGNAPALMDSVKAGKFQVLDYGGRSYTVNVPNKYKYLPANNNTTFYISK